MSSFHCSWWIRETCQTCRSPAPRAAPFPGSRCPERKLLAGATRRAGWLAGDARPFSRPVLISWPQVLTRTQQADGNASSWTAPRSLAQVAGSIGPGARRPSALYWVLPVFREDRSKIIQGTILKKYITSDTHDKNRLIGVMKLRNKLSFSSYSICLLPWASLFGRDL